MTIQHRISQLGILLPDVSKPGGNYVSVNVRSNLAYIAIQFPKNGQELTYQGRLGDTLTTQDGYDAMRICALNVLTLIDRSFGFDTVAGLNHVDAYYQSSDDWDDSARVVDGASDLFMDVLAERGVHTRAIFGVHKLPKNYCVGLTCSLTLLRGDSTY